MPSVLHEALFIRQWKCAWLQFLHALSELGYETARAIIIKSRANCYHVGETFDKIHNGKLLFFRLGQFKVKHTISSDAGGHKNLNTNIVELLKTCVLLLAQYPHFH